MTRHTHPDIRLSKQGFAQLLGDVKRFEYIRDIYYKVDLPADWATLTVFEDKPPETAASMVREIWQTSNATSVQERLGFLGVECGMLSPNPEIPEGVYGFYQHSLYPTMMLSPERAIDSNRAYSIARALGDMIYRQSLLRDEPRDGELWEDDEDDATLEEDLAKAQQDTEQFAILLAPYLVTTPAGIVAHELQG